MTLSLREEILNQIDRLTPDQQREVLDFVLSLEEGLPEGIPGRDMAARAIAINFPHEDLEEISRAIEEDCETIDWESWQ